MSETTDKPKLGARAPLGLKRTVETGKVKQSFSHGRTKQVAVEVRVKRAINRPGAGGAAQPAAPGPGVPPPLRPRATPKAAGIWSIPPSRRAIRMSACCASAKSHLRMARSAVPSPA